MNNPTRAEAGVAVLTAAVATAVWGVAKAAGVDLVVRSGSGTSDINVVSVIVTALVVAIVGAALLRLLERRTANGRRTWTIVAVVVWAVSFLGPLSATRPSAGLVLACLHLLVGAVVVLGLRRTHAAGPAAPNPPRPAEPAPPEPDPRSVTAVWDGLACAFRRQRLGARLDPGPAARAGPRPPRNASARRRSSSR